MRRRNPEYKPLDEYYDVEEVEAALAAGDTRLAKELESLIESEARNAEHRVVYDYDNIEKEEIVDAFDPTDVLQECSRLWSLPENLQEVASTMMREELVYAISSQASRYFSIDSQRVWWHGTHLSWTIPGRFSVEVQPDFENPELVPEKYANKFWKILENSLSLSEGWHEPTDRVDDKNYAFGEYDAGTVHLDNVEEFCSDIFRQVVESMNENDKLDIFLKEVESSLGQVDTKKLFSKLKKEEILDFIDDWLSDDDTSQSVLDRLNHYIEILKDPKSLIEKRKALLEISPEVLSQMGLRKGPIAENAPWYLISLAPDDLSIEGALMKHCVGQYSMGYRDAVENGDIEVWSFRSRHGKPRFTLEVDTRFYETSDPDKKALTIKQLKGKGNRTPGYAQLHSSDIHFPDEVAVWDYILRTLGVNPERVSDFPALQQSQPRSFPELRTNPRKRPRSFDEPYRPLKLHF